MRIGIMQPYFLPYLGYFQLISAVDIFVVYDNIKYTKKGWINRNRYLNNGKIDYFTVQIKRDSDYLNIVDRLLAENFKKDKLLNQIAYAYKKAPYFEEIYPLLEKIILNCNSNLFMYIFCSIKEILLYLDIPTSIVKSSDIAIDHNLKGTEKVIAICKELQGNIYINPIGGINLYDNQHFKDNNLDLKFINMNDDIEYRQFEQTFISSLSIIDVLMFNEKEQVKKMLQWYKLLN